MHLNDNEIKVVWAALAAMVLDIHAPQDQLTEKEREIAETLFSEIDTMINISDTEFGDD